MVILMSLGALLVYLWWYRDTVTTAYCFCSAFFISYITLLLGEVVGFPSISEFRRVSETGQSLFNPDILWIPFDQGVDMSTFLNILAFIPLGILLTIMWETFNHFAPILILGVLFSLIIEAGQLFTLYRYSDINDVIMNTIGVLIGWVIAKWSLTWDVRRGDGKNLDWLVYLGISFSSVFMFG